MAAATNDKTSTANVTSNVKSEDPKDVASKDVAMVDIHNPTSATRVIYDGITTEHGRQNAITIVSGDTKKNVKLHRTIITELRDRNRAKKNSDLVVSAASADDETETKPAA